MRVYLVSDVDALRGLSDVGSLAADVAFAASAGMSEEAGIAEDDVEYAEFLAMTAALRHALSASRDADSARVADPQGRLNPVIIVAADLDTEADAPDDGRIRVNAPVPRSRIASFHVADSGVRGASVSDQEGLDAGDLAWWAAQELNTLLDYLDAERQHHG